MCDDVYEESLYVTSEVARLLRMSPAKARRWLQGTGTRKALLLEHRAVPRGEASFNDLIELRLVQELMKHFPIQQIRKQHRNLSRQFGTAHPFVRKGLYVSGRTLVAEFEEGGESHFLDAGTSGQTLIRDVVRQVAREIRFDDFRAIEWRPLQGGRVVVDPLHLFGAPRVDGRNIPTKAVYGMYLAEGSRVEPVRDWFGLEEHDVLDAVRYEASLIQGSRAA